MADAFSEQYAKFDTLYDSDDDKEKAEKEAKRNKVADQRRKVAEGRAAAAAKAAGCDTSSGTTPVIPVPGAPAAGPRTMMNSMDNIDMENMTEKQRAEFLDNYAKIFNRNRPKNTQYKFPETFEEQRAKCEEADELRQRGNALYKAGELTEAAKLYEQAVPPHAASLARLPTCPPASRAAWGQELEA